MFLLVLLFKLVSTWKIMHYKCDSLIFLSLIFFPPTIGQRRIIGGRTTNANATFVVYLLAAEPAAYPGWLCGGAIVDRWYVLTAAACLEDVQFIYVVAGYEKYVSAEHMDEDRCISRTRKRIISWCYQSDYTSANKDNDTTHIWASTDIALARVNEPFDFYDPIYEKYCSYLPSMITVGIGETHRMPGAGVLAYGWGHRKYISPVGDDKDYNSDKLYYASTRILAFEECEKEFSLASIKENIGKHAICTSGPGYLDDQGQITDQMDTHNVECGSANDHGGPLVMWTGGELFVVGVASFYRVANDLKCTSPYVFMGTACVSKFLMCILSRTRRSKDCVQGNNIEVVENLLDWTEFDKTSHVIKKEDPPPMRTYVMEMNTSSLGSSSTEMRNPHDFKTNSEVMGNPPDYRKNSEEKGDPLQLRTNFKAEETSRTLI